MIRVLHIVTIMNRGGLETMIMNYYRNIDKSKIQFDFLVHRYEKGAFDEEILKLGGKIYQLPRLNPFSLSYRKKLNTFFKKGKYNIIHVHQDCMSSIVLKYAYKNDVQFRIAHSHNASQDKNLKYIIKIFYKKYIPKYATHLFACGKEAGDWMFGNSNYTIINNAIDAKKYRYNCNIRKIKREKLNLSQKKVIIHIGRFNHQKNHPFLIDIFYEVLKFNKNFILLLIGDGEDKRNIENKVNELKISDYVLFLGIREDVSDLLQVADIFLLPSYFEGLSLASIEAQAAGLPCLISDTIPIECKKTDLVWQMSLNETPKQWAKKIQSLVEIKRIDTYESIKKGNFDINENAKWLSNFYLKLGHK